MDLLNAIHALSLAVRLVTNNTRKFQRVPGLRLENWVWRRRQGRHSTPRKPLRCKGKLRFEKWERANIILQDVTPYYAFRPHFDDPLNKISSRFDELETIIRGEGGSKKTSGTFSLSLFLPSHSTASAEGASRVEWQVRY